MNKREHRILERLSQGPASPADLSRDTGIRPRTLTLDVLGLEQVGWLTMAIGVRRITPAGREAFLRHPRPWRQIMNERERKILKRLVRAPAAAGYIVQDTGIGPHGVADGLEALFELGYVYRAGETWGPTHAGYQAVREPPRPGKIRKAVSWITGRQ